MEFHEDSAKLYRNVIDPMHRHSRQSRALSEMGVLSVNCFSLCFTTCTYLNYSFVVNLAILFIAVFIC